MVLIRLKNLILSNSRWHNRKERQINTASLLKTFKIVWLELPDKNHAIKEVIIRRSPKKNKVFPI